MKERVIKLLDYLGLDHDTEVKESGYYENSYTIDGKEYLVLNDEEADYAHEEYIRNFIDDLGIKGFSEFAQNDIIENYVDTSWFDEAMEDSYKNYIEDIKLECSSDENFENRLEEEMSDSNCDDEDDYLEYLCNMNYNSVEWYRFNFGEADFSECVNKYCSVDIEGIAEYCKEIDGRGYNLSSYDGLELELDNNYYAYRIA